MAKVTIELRNCLKIEEFDLFDFDYPIVDETWKEELEQDIINYFYFHEIGQETIDRFMHSFKTRMKLIMPYYNELFNTKIKDIDPLLTKHITETMEDQSAINSNLDSDSSTLFTEYPEHDNIVDDIASNKSTGTSSNVQATSTEHDYTKIIKGGSFG